ncbi:MAG: hypothetical protein V1848_01245 [Candidatus Magasanikbacteria bacterium]
MKNHWAIVIQYLLPGAGEIKVDADIIQFTLPEALANPDTDLQTLKWHLCLTECTISQDPTPDGKSLVTITTNKPFLTGCPTPVEHRAANAILFERYPSG